VSLRRPSCPYPLVGGECNKLAEKGLRGAVARLAGLLGRAMTVAFIVMLVAAGVSLALGLEDVANKMAEVGYYFLVVAVASMLADVVTEK
jgi:hypothetical protein